MPQIYRGGVIHNGGSPHKLLNGGCGFINMNDMYK